MVTTGNFRKVLRLYKNLRSTVVDHRRFLEMAASSRVKPALAVDGSEFRRATQYCRCDIRMQHFASIANIIFYVLCVCFADSISMTTFNVGLLSKPSNLSFDMEKLVAKEMEILPVAVSDKSVDIAVIGFQELSRTPFYRLYDFFLGESWTESLTLAMASRGYFLLHKIRLNGVMMLMFVRYHMLPYIRDVTELRVRWEPLFPYWGSKGTVGLSMRIYGQNLCFLCSHLPAHTVFNHLRIEVGF